MSSYGKLAEFYKGKNVLVTGHTGFKGSWMCKVLELFGAKVTGYALEPPTEPSLFSILGLDRNPRMPGGADSCGLTNIIGDIRDLDLLTEVFDNTKPEIVIHMAAQPLVRESYANPVGTYSTNVMGTVNIMECCRKTKSVRSVVNVTTDKVYRNNEWEKGYVETDYLDGYDPYSNSKSCSELVTHSYIQSFFNADKERQISVSTCRAGNVLGGGDFAKDRIIPDCVRAAQAMEDIIVRNPYSTRPYEHVLEPVMTYLYVAMMQYDDLNLASSYNVGPNDESCVNTGKLVDMFVEKWNKKPLTDCEGGPRPDIKWVNKSDGGPHEAGFLKLDCTKLKTTFDWEPVWNIDKTMDKVVQWYRAYLSGEDCIACSEMQIREYLEDAMRG